MKSKISTYSTEKFRKKYLDESSALNQLFDKSLEDFFCLRIEDVIEDFKLPVLPSRENCHSIILITEGLYTTKIGFEEFTIKPNQIVVIQAGAIFSVDQIPENVKGFACHFHPDTLIGKYGDRALISAFEFLDMGNHPVIVIKESQKAAIQNLLVRLLAEFEGISKPNAEIIHVYLYALLTELKTLFVQNHVDKQHAAYQITAQFRKLAHEKVKENLKVSDFANMMSISPNHLNKAVKSITTKSASEVINEIKLIEIKYLLYQSDLSINEISYEMGCLDPSYFTRFFKKRENISPTKFRKLIEKS